MFFVLCGVLLRWGALGDLMVWGGLAGGGSYVLEGCSSVLGLAVSVPLPLPLQLVQRILTRQSHLRIKMSDPPEETTIHICYDDRNLLSWCAMWDIDGRTRMRPLSVLELELLNRPDPALVRFPSNHDAEEREYTIMIKVEIAPNVVAAIEKIQFDLAAQFDPLTEDMGKGGVAGKWEGWGD